MPVTWTKERYEEGYDGAPEGTLAWTNSRFVWQVDCLIKDFGLKPEVDSLVILGDGWGGVATELARLGYVLTGSESSQYIIDNWHLYGSPHITKPTLSNSYSEAARTKVKVSATGTAGITPAWLSRPARTRSMISPETKGRAASWISTRFGARSARAARPRRTDS